MMWQNLLGMQLSSSGNLENSFTALMNAFRMIPLSIKQLLLWPKAALMEMLPLP